MAINVYVPDLLQICTQVGIRVTMIMLIYSAPHS